MRQVGAAGRAGQGVHDQQGQSAQQARQLQPGVQLHASAWRLLWSRACTTVHFNNGHCAELSSLAARVLPLRIPSPWPVASTHILAGIAPCCDAGALSSSHVQTRHQYEIHLESSSVVELCPDEEDIPNIFFNVMPGRSLPGIPMLFWRAIVGLCCCLRLHVHPTRPARLGCLRMFITSQICPLCCAAVCQGCHGGGHPS